MTITLSTDIYERDELLLSPLGRKTYLLQTIPFYYYFSPDLSFVLTPKYMFVIVDKKGGNTFKDQRRLSFLPLSK